MCTHLSGHTSSPFSFSLAPQAPLVERVAERTGALVGAAGEHLSAGVRSGEEVFAERAAEREERAEREARQHEQEEAEARVPPADLVISTAEILASKE